MLLNKKAKNKAAKLTFTIKLIHSLNLQSKTTLLALTIIGINLNR